VNNFDNNLTTARIDQTTGFAGDEACGKPMTSVFHNVMDFKSIVSSNLQRKEFLFITPRPLNHSAQTVDFKRSSRDFRRVFSLRNIS